MCVQEYYLFALYCNIVHFVPAQIRFVVLVDVVLEIYEDAADTCGFGAAENEVL